MASRRGEPKKSNVPFDYFKTKTKYMRAIEKYEILHLWRAKEFENIKYEMKSSRYKGTNTIYAQKYEVFKTQQGSEILILNRDKSPKIIECVSAEDSFDVFVDIHLATGHGGKAKMLQNMRQRYHVSTACLKIFLELCNVCKSDKKSVKAIENNLAQTAFLSILDLTSEKDGGFGFVLMYKLKWSGFTLLRPLTISNFEQDIALELLNIFLDFGPPVKILVEVSRFDVLTKAMSYISNMTCDCNVLIEKNTKSADVFDFVLTKKIKDLVNQANIRQWSIACPLIQWKLNNSISDDPGKPECPQRMHFKSDFVEEIAPLIQDDDEDISMEVEESGQTNVGDEQDPSTSKSKNT